METVAKLIATDLEWWFHGPPKPPAHDENAHRGVQPDQVQVRAEFLDNPILNNENLKIIKK